MELRMGIRVTLAAMALGWMLTATGQTIPALKEIPPEVAAMRPDLVSRRTALEAERNALRGRVMAQKAQCTSVQQNTPDWDECLRLRTQLQAEMRAHAAQSEAFNASVPDAPAPEPVKPAPTRQYVYAGNGLIAGTTWTLYASRKPGEPEERMCNVIKLQSQLAGSPYDKGVDCKRYQFVLGMAVSVDPFTDLSERVAFDDLTNGRFSAETQGLYDKLRGKEFGELGCHSNGAMICLAALENEDVKADHVVLYGPQVTRESLEMWNKLVQDGKIKSVKVYLNENDIVPGTSIAYADYKKYENTVIQSAKANPAGNGVVEAGAAVGEVIGEGVSLMNIERLKRTINETSPRLEVQSFPCERDRLSLDCHSMSMYKSKVNCTGRSSGAAVPGTRLPGGVALPEPPVPCEALGAR